MYDAKEVIVTTGFEPFANFPVNPSWEAAKAFNNKDFGSFNSKAFQIPLVYKEIRPAIIRIIEVQRPKIIISLGQSYRPVISLEKVAINLADLTESTILYNCGTQPKDEVLEPNAPAAYFTTLPIEKILRELRKHYIPSEISFTAGTFGCNQLFFHTMHEIHSEGLNIPAGFIHVPCLPSQAVQLQNKGKGKIPSMELETMTEALEIAIQTTVETTKQ